MIRHRLTALCKQCPSVIKPSERRKSSHSHQPGVNGSSKVRIHPVDLSYGRHWISGLHQRITELNAVAGSERFEFDAGREARHRFLPSPEQTATLTEKLMTFNRGRRRLDSGLRRIDGPLDHDDIPWITLARQYQKALRLPKTREGPGWIGVNQRRNQV